MWLDKFIKCVCVFLSMFYVYKCVYVYVCDFVFQKQAVIYFVWFSFLPIWVKDYQDKNYYQKSFNFAQISWQSGFKIKTIIWSQKKIYVQVIKLLHDLVLRNYPHPEFIFVLLSHS